MAVSTEGYQGGSSSKKSCKGQEELAGKRQCDESREGVSM